MVKRFRTRPVEIEAMQFTGDNFQELWDWTEGNFRRTRYTTLAKHDDFEGGVWDQLHHTWIYVKAGQWIVRGAKGEYYPCDDETFHWKYEEVV